MTEKLPGPITRWIRILHTIWLTYKQDREFWDKDPRPGRCPYSPGKATKVMLKAHEKEEQKHASKLPARTN